MMAVHPPKSSKDPQPIAVSIKPKSGKQHGEVMAVKKIPTTPSLSRLVENFIDFKYCFIYPVGLLIE